MIDDRTHVNTCTTSSVHDDDHDTFTVICKICIFPFLHTKLYRYTAYLGLAYVQNEKQKITDDNFKLHANYESVYCSLLLL